MQQKFIFFLIFILCFFAQSETILGPFNPSSGNWTLVANGSFENGMTSWVDIAPEKGIFRTSSNYSTSGSYSVQSIANINFSGPGYGSGQTIAVTGGQSYVLSAFFHQGNLTTGALYVDTGDVSFEQTLYASISSTLESRWQFTWGIVNVPVGVSSIFLRLVRDGVVNTGEYGYIDQVAFTPLSQFVAPTPVPETQNFVMLLVFLAIVIFCHWKSVRNTSVLV